MEEGGWNIVVQVGKVVVHGPWSMGFSFSGDALREKSLLEAAVISFLSSFFEC